MNIVCIISYFLSTISFSLQLHFTALLMSCSPSWPMAKMLLLTSLLSILFNNNLLEVVREEEKGVQHAFNIKMGKYSDRCEAEGILFSWRLWESLSSRRCYIYTRWENDQERILKTIFFTVKSILEWGSWWTQLPLGPNWHLQLLQLLFRYIEAGGIPSILFHYIALLFSTTICWYPLPFWYPFYFMCARGASSRSW